MYACFTLVSRSSLYFFFSSIAFFFLSSKTILFLPSGPEVAPLHESHVVGLFVAQLETQTHFFLLEAFLDFLLVNFKDSLLRALVEMLGIFGPIVGLIFFLLEVVDVLLDALLVLPFLLFQEPAYCLIFCAARHSLQIVNMAAPLFLRSELLFLLDQKHDLPLLLWGELWHAIFFQTFFFQNFQLFRWVQILLNFCHDLIFHVGFGFREVDGFLGGFP